MSNQTIPGLPTAGALLGSEQVWVVQSGRDVRTTTEDIAQFSGAGGGTVGDLVTSSGMQLFINGFFGVKTSLGAFTGILPPLDSVAAPGYLEVADIDYDAAAHNYTVEAFSGDMISDHGVLGASYVINVSNTITRFIANTNSWTVITYGS